MQQDTHPTGGMDRGENRISFWRRHRSLLWVAAGVLICLALLAVLVNIAANRAEPFARERIVQALADRFHARVELDVLHLSLGNSLHGEWGVWADGRGLRIWPPASVEESKTSLTASSMQPLIQLGEFRFHVPLRYRSGAPIHIRLVHLAGLEIRIPPRSRMERAIPSPQPTAPEAASGLPAQLQFQIGTVDCKGARVELQTDKPGKLPIEIVIRRFTVTGVRPGEPMKFDAEIINPRPPGEIHTIGRFGPWNVDDPGESPVKGEYRFDYADLSVFSSIAGILNSTGQYEGTLRRVTVDGETDTPDFQLSHVGNPMDVHTTFHARVDATNGDTWLEPVEGTLGRTRFRAQGRVVRVLAPGDDGKPHSTGHDTSLAFTVVHGRLEDFLHLANRSSVPVLTGDVSLNVLLHIPPGPVPVHQRMTVAGQFLLEEAAFTSLKVQSRINELSLRAQGRPHDAKTSDPTEVRSQMQGEFQLGGGLLKLPAVTYDVPGADIQIHGVYQIPADNLDFTGVARFQATISQAVGGWKGLLLKPADRFFRKDGAGSEIPIRITGTRERPEFGFDSAHLKTTHPERPGAQN